MSEKLGKHESEKLRARKKAKNRMSDLQRKQLDAILAKDIITPCSYHPAGRNHLLLNPLEREEIIKRIEQIGIGQKYTSVDLEEFQ